jgi:phenylacetic acid degradation operon negative regulatory protein
MRVSAKQVILEVLSAGVPEGASIPVRHLVRAAAVFDIAENSVRVALVRLRAEGLIEPVDRGQYRLGPSATPLNERIIGWRTVEDRLRPWAGDWIGAFVADLSRTDRPALRRRTRALRLLGFRELRPGFDVRPNNLAAGVEGVREQLLRLGLDEEAPVFRITDLGDDEGCARALWDREELLRSYRDLRTEIAEARKRQRTLPPEACLEEHFLLGREAIRLIVLDPLLPEPLAPVDERRALVTDARDYNDAGLRLWAAFLGPPVGQAAPRMIASEPLAVAFA